jgi:hypothetical protein
MRHAQCGTTEQYAATVEDRQPRVPIGIHKLRLTGKRGPEGGIKVAAGGLSEGLGV